MVHPPRLEVWSVIWLSAQHASSGRAILESEPCLGIKAMPYGYLRRFPVLVWLDSQVHFPMIDHQSSPYCSCWSTACSTLQVQPTLAQWLPLTRPVSFSFMFCLSSLDVCLSRGSHCYIRGPCNAQMAPKAVAVRNAGPMLLEAQDCSK